MLSETRSRIMQKVRPSTCVSVLTVRCRRGKRRGNAGLSVGWWQRSGNFGLARTEWCCWGGLNSRPQPYQGCALPLSYSSQPFLLRKPPRRLGRGGLMSARLANVKDRLVARRVCQHGLDMSDANPPVSREQRLAAQLRENLKRRKAQARNLDKAEAPPLPKVPPSG